MSFEPTGITNGEMEDGSERSRPGSTAKITGTVTWVMGNVDAMGYDIDELPIIAVVGGKRDCGLSG